MADRTADQIELTNLGRGSKFTRYRISDTRNVEYWVGGSRGSWRVDVALRDTTEGRCGGIGSRMPETERTLDADAPSLKAIREIIAADLATR